MKAVGVGTGRVWKRDVVCSEINLFSDFKKCGDFSNVPRMIRFHFKKVKKKLILILKISMMYNMKLKHLTVRVSVEHMAYCHARVMPLSENNQRQDAAMESLPFKPQRWLFFQQPHSTDMFYSSYPPASWQRSLFIFYLFIVTLRNTCIITPYVIAAMSRGSFAGFDTHGASWCPTVAFVFVCPKTDQV